MRHGAMAVSRITHFGIPEKNAALVLRAEGEAYRWFEVRNDAVSKLAFRIEDVERHLEVLLNDRIR
jgi:hypothetical protein